ncbi:probable aspartic protease At2g35615 [Chenopodium quinoa]|uniref:probable aspartic protease At2g35615 n=1 Tax=Chenopodium quinoa TaxID=63459 RepID=UPI000B798A81|nr:probable aspartic protease At2g35615 [Chenopodium quinoa]
MGHNSTSSPMLKTELIIDTGSSLTWVQATPCDSCYEQGTFPYYNRFASESYEAINCKDEICKDVPRASHNECLDLPWDSKEPCSYDTEYGDGTTSSGVIGTETFYFQDPYVGFGNEPVTFVPFGLGTSNHIPQWVNASTPGIAGLMRGPGTLIDRLKVKKFSHCFSRDEDATGKWIPMENDVLPTKMMFDTGFTHSFLDPDIMDAVVEAIKDALGRYQPRKVKGFELCYDLTQLYSVSLDEVAKITFEFNYTTDIHMFSFHLWERQNENQLICLRLRRGPPKENIFGNNLMREVNIGYTLDEDDLAMYFHRQHCT